jgi:hypothetical protein
MSRYDKFFQGLEGTINKSLESVSKSRATAPGTLEEMVKSLSDKVDTLFAAVHPEGPIAKTIEGLKSDQDLINQAVEKALERVETVEKSGARPHSVAGDNTPVPQTEIEKAKGEWDQLIKYVGRGGRAILK